MLQLYCCFQLADICKGYKNININIKINLFLLYNFWMNFYIFKIKRIKKHILNSNIPRSMSPLKLVEKSHHETHKQSPKTRGAITGIRTWRGISCLTELKEREGRKCFQNSIGKAFFLLKMPSDSLNCNAIKNEMVKVQRAQIAECYKWHTPLHEGNHWTMTEIRTILHWTS